MKILCFKQEKWTLCNQVAKCIFGYRKLLLSYSGGIDSTVLLDVLTTLRNAGNYYSIPHPLIIRAVYIHHGIHRDANNWAIHCAQECKKRNISFNVIYMNDYRNTVNYKKNNIEAMGRYFRYKKLYKYLHSDEILVTAHHMDDQAETLLLALKRGSGPSGLSGIAYQGEIFLHNHKHKIKVLRPLLNCSRLQIEKYAYHQKLTWIEDDSNKDIYFDRNYLRISILPLLYNRWPSFKKLVFRTATLCTNQENLLDELLSEFIKKLIDIDGALFYRPLFQCSSLKRHAVLRLWLTNCFVQIPSYQLTNRIWKEVVLSKQDAKPVLRIHQYFCSRFKEKLYIIPATMMSMVNGISLTWELSTNSTMVLPYNLGLLISHPVYNIDNKKFISNINIAEKELDINYLLNIFSNFFKKPGMILTSCLIRFPMFNEKISIRFGSSLKNCFTYSKKQDKYLKKIWKEHSIPPWLRNHIPLLFYNNTLISVIGVFVTFDGKNSDYEDMNLKIYWMQEKSFQKLFQSSIYPHVQ